MKVSVYLHSTYFQFNNMDKEEAKKLCEWWSGSGWSTYQLRDGATIYHLRRNEVVAIIVKDAEGEKVDEGKR